MKNILYCILLTSFCVSGDYSTILKKYKYKPSGLTLLIVEQLGRVEENLNIMNTQELLGLIHMLKLLEQDIEQILKDLSQQRSESTRAIKDFVVDKCDNLLWILGWIGMLIDFKREKLVLNLIKEVFTADRFISAQDLMKKHGKFDENTAGLFSLWTKEKKEHLLGIFTSLKEQIKDMKIKAEQQISKLPQEALKSSMNDRQKILGCAKYLIKAATADMKAALEAIAFTAWPDDKLQLFFQRHMVSKYPFQTFALLGVGNYILNCIVSDPNIKFDPSSLKSMQDTFKSMRDGKVEKILSAISSYTESLSVTCKKNYEFSLKIFPKTTDAMFADQAGSLVDAISLLNSKNQELQDKVDTLLCGIKNCCIVYLNNRIEGRNSPASKCIDIK